VTLLPELALKGTWSSGEDAAPVAPVAVLIINFNTTAQTLRCIDSLRGQTIAPAIVMVLDNASASDNRQMLEAGCWPLLAGGLRLYHSDVNLGFAGGMNALIDLALQESETCDYICLLNNDAVAAPTMLETLLSTLQATTGTHLAGGRVHQLLRPSEVDSLGITVYASLMPSDRKTTSDPLLGPTGGCLIMTRAFVNEMISAAGYCFDERFFCYCEDTDLVLRAALMGYRAAYCDEVVAWHEGQASSGGVSSPFIAYHGLRNIIWMHWKLIPTRLLLKYGPLLVTAHLMSCVRMVAMGRFGLMWSIYRDAWLQFPEFWRERKRWRALRRVPVKVLADLIAPRFYRRGYLIESIRRLLNA
jgi:GT2 family glycosyltransferase